MPQNPSTDAIPSDSTITVDSNGVIDSNIIWLQEAHPRQLELIGFKALNLGVAARLKLPVPNGFVITSHAYRQCLQEMGFRPDNFLRLSYEEALTTARTIQHCFIKQAIPSAVLTDIRAAYKQLTEHQDLGVVIRPSLIYGNGVDFSKRLRPILGIKSLIELEKALKMAWAYMWLDDIIQYRFSQDHLRERWDDLALLIQPLIQPYASGSVLSYDPASADQQSFVIEAARGLNEAVSRGVIVPDRYIWHRPSQKVSAQQIVSKPLRFILAEQGAVQEVPIEPSQRLQSTLAESDLSSLANLTEKLMEAYQRPLEFEWSKTETGLCLIQIMPGKVLNQHDLKVQDWVQLEQFAPYFEKPVSSFGWSVLEPTLNQSMRRLCDWLGFDTASLPAQSFCLHEQKIVLHPGVFELLEQQLQSYWAEVGDLPAYRRYLKFIWQLWRFQQQWHQGYRDFVDGMQEHWRLNYDSQGAEQLLDYLDEILNHLGNFIVYALLMRVLSYLNQVMFSDFVQNYLPAEQDYQILLQALPGRLSKSQQLVLTYIHEIQQRPDWIKLFKQNNPHHVLRALQMDDYGKVWLARLQSDFAMVGYEKISMEPLYPSWVEAPQVLIHALQLQLNQPQELWDQQQVDQREDLVFEIVNQYDWKQLHKRFFFLSLLHLNQNYRSISLDEPFYFAMLFPRLRSVVLSLARYLPLDSRQDVFYLEQHELQEMIQNPMNAYKIKELRELIQARKYKRRITHQLGSEAAGGLKAIELKGYVAYPGEVLGRIRVVTKSSDLKALQTGEIMVTDYFEPFWEQSLSKVSGLILELGGSLSHGAMLARHYGIPAIAGVENATKKLVNGLVVRLDARHGKVFAYQEDALEGQEEFI